MKAVIMAGGKGSRLCPLTCNLPKPMVPLLDRPCMEYIIDLLKRHGITEIAVTLQYLPQAIMNHFGDGSEYGVNLRYFAETVPLGTAGSVKNAEEFLDETFLVISGDALTDFDLSAAIAFHRAKGADGTLLLARVDVPLEYGVVMTAEDGRIIRFLEKPSWSEVFSDTVNTGIYVLEPDILRFFSKGEKFDFSKDLFPLCLKNGTPLFGFAAEGYWSDIGGLTQYRQTQFDMLNGAVDVNIKGIESSPGVWLGQNVRMSRGVTIEGPAFIGDGSVVESGAKIGPHTVIGRYNLLEQGASLEKTVIWNRNYLSKSTVLTGAGLCSGIRIGAGTHVEEDAVVGENSWIGARCVLKRSVKIWPGKVVGSGSIQRTSLIWGKSVSPGLFGSEGISGIANLEMNPELVGRIAAAYGSCLPRGVTVSVSCDKHPYSDILKFAAISSLLAIGVNVRDIGHILAPIARYECRCSNSEGGIHIRKAMIQGEKRMVLQFFDQDGLPVDKGKERKIENAFIQEDFARPGMPDLGCLEQSKTRLDGYVQEILEHIDKERIRECKFKIVFYCEHPLVNANLHEILQKMGCRSLAILAGEEMLEKVVVDNQADLGVKLDAGGQTLQLISEHGHLLSEDELLILQTLVSLKGFGPVAVPVSAPSIAEKLVEDAGRPAVRTKNMSRSLLEVGKIRPLQVHYDAFYCLAVVIDHLAQNSTTLHTVISDLPKFHMSRHTVACPSEAKGKVMRKLMEEMKGQTLELIDGIKVLSEDAWALILPDSEQGFFNVVTQGSNGNNAVRLANMYKEKIVAYQRG